MTRYPELPPSLVELEEETLERWRAEDTRTPSAAPSTPRATASASSSSKALPPPTGAPVCTT